MWKSLHVVLYLTLHCVWLWNFGRVIVVRWVCSLLWPSTGTRRSWANYYQGWPDLVYMNPSMRVFNKLNDQGMTWLETDRPFTIVRSLEDLVFWVCDDHYLHLKLRKDGDIPLVSRLLYLIVSQPNIVYSIESILK